MNGSEYPDHRSPVRAARERARRRLPCAQCSSVHEPVIRRARYLSAAWRRDPAACFACADCGMPLEPLGGSAAFRESDIAADRIPDPAGALTHFDLAGELEKSGWAGEGEPDLDATLALLRERITAVAPPISSRCPATGRSAGRGGIEFRVLGMPWMNVELVIAGDGGRVDLAGVVDDLLERAAAGAEASFAVCLASLGSWQLTDRDLPPAGAGLAEAREFSWAGEPWQMRSYRVAGTVSGG